MPIDEKNIRWDTPTPKRQATTLNPNNIRWDTSKKQVATIDPDSIRWDSSTGRASKMGASVSTLDVPEATKTFAREQAAKQPQKIDLDKLAGIVKETPTGTLEAAGGLASGAGAFLLSLPTAAGEVAKAVMAKPELLLQQLNPFADTEEKTEAWEELSDMIDWSTARKEQEKIQEALTYKPKTNFGKFATEVGASPFALYQQGVEKLIEDLPEQEQNKYRIMADVALVALPKIGKGTAGRLKNIRWDEKPSVIEQAVNDSVKAPLLKAKEAKTIGEMEGHIKEARSNANEIVKTHGKEAEAVVNRAFEESKAEPTREVPRVTERKPIVPEAIKQEIEQQTREFKPSGIEAPEVIKQEVERGIAKGIQKPKPTQFKDIRTWIKSKGGIDYKTEHLKGELDRIAEDKSIAFTINKKGKGETLDTLAMMAKDEGFLRGNEAPTPDNLLKALFEKRKLPEVLEEKEFEKGYAESIERGRQKAMIDPTSLKEGQEVVIQGERFKKETDPTTGDVILKDGETIRRDAFDPPIRVDEVIEPPKKAKQTFKEFAEKRGKWPLMTSDPEYPGLLKQYEESGKKAKPVQQGLEAIEREATREALKGKMPTRELAETPLERGAREAKGREVEAEERAKQGKLEEAIGKTAKTVDEFIDETLPVGLSTKDVSKTRKVNDTINLPESGTLTSESLQVENRWRAAKGIKGPKLIERISEVAGKVKRSFTRHFPELDSKTDGAVIDVLRQHETIPEYAKVSATEVLKGVTATLGPKKYDVFTRNLILPDILKDIDRGLLKEDSLPFGYKDRGMVERDLNKFRAIAEKNPDIMEALSKRKGFMDSLKNELVKYNLLPEEVLKDESYFHHQVLEYMNNRRYAGVSSKDVRLKKKGWQRARIGSEKDFNTEYLESEFEVIAQGIAQLETAKTLESIQAIADIKPRLKALADKRGVDWKDLIPEDYTVWQPKQGSAFYVTNSLTDKVIEQVLSGEKMLEDADVKKALAIGRKRAEWVIPERLAKTLDDFRSYRDEGILSNASDFLISTWKQWTLLNPFRVVKYNLNNLSGDFDIVFAYDPKILQYTGGAAKELLSTTKGKAMSPEARTAQRKGVIGSGISIHEIPDITMQGAFKLLTGENPNLISKYWNTTKDYTNWRENVLRYAAYKHFKAELAKGKKLYGASKKTEIDAITNIDDKAAKLARELVGDYGNLTQAGQWIRKHLIPFYSWMEINAPRYVRLVKNLPHEGKEGGTGKVAGVVAGKTAWKGTKLAVKAGTLYTLVNVWNNTFFPEEEKELKDAQRRQIHLILGRREDGTIRTMRFQGALSDALSWLALEDLPQDIEDIASGTATFMKKGKEALLAPAQKVILGSRPIIKTFGEVLTGRSLYPDITNPRAIRDKAEHVSRTFSVDMIYRIAANKPTRGLEDEISRILFYDTDPGEAAYYTIRSKAIDYLKEHGEEIPSIIPSKKQNALYYHKQALKYGDMEAAERYLKQYYDMGGTKKGMALSKLKSKPLAILPNKHRSGFKDSLTPDEKAMLDRAEAWYKEWMKK